MQNQLLSYIKIAQKAGQTEEQIKQALRQSGWDEKSINEAFGGVQAGATPIPPPPKKGWVSGWDAFEHSLMFVSLLFASSSFALILHTFVNQWVPKVESYYNYYSGWALTGSLATLIVSFPLFALLHLDVVRRTIKNPVIRSLKSRKFFIYLTLLITFIIMMSKLIQTVYNFLQGNLTPNFLLHLLVTFGVSGTIFFYYLYQVREDRRSYA